MSVTRKQWIIRPMELEDTLAAAKIGKAAFADSEISQYLTPPRLRRHDVTPKEKEIKAASLMRARVGKGAITALHPDTGKIVGYAVWPSASYADAGYNPLPPLADRDPQTDWTAQAKFRSQLGEHASKVMGNRKHWYLVAIATHRDYERQGIARDLVEWGTSRADQEGVPCLVESVPSAVPLYEKAGFKHVDKFTLDFPGEDEAGLPTGKTRQILLYVMVREPRPAA